MFHPVDKIVYILSHRAQEQTITNLLKQKNTNGIPELLTLFWNTVWSFQSKNSSEVDNI